MGFEKAVSYLDSLGPDAMKSMAPSLHRIEALCEALNHPERAVPAIHVTGTNGKTSTARIATSLLQVAGLSVGTYTSPHLQTIRERIALNGQPIDGESFGDVFDHLRPYLELTEGRLEESLTYFEILTAMFFLWAAEQPVDAMVVEVGLGGRWDATNVIDAPVAIITNIGLDHAGLLGKERTTIAREKSGVIDQDAIVVTAERAPDVLAVIRGEADKAQAQVSALDRDFAIADNRIAVGGRYLSLNSSRASYEGLYLPLHGSHQGLNAAVALEAATRFLPAQPLGQELVEKAFSETKAPGRLERVRVGEGSPVLVLDVAHNPDGVSALVSSLLEAFAFERAIFVVGILSDKDHRGMLAELERVECSLIITAARSERATPPEDLRAVAEGLGHESEVIDDVAKAVDAALERATKEELVCVMGSHYVVGEARSHVLGALQE